MLDESMKPGTDPQIPNWADEAERGLKDLEAKIATGQIGLAHGLARAFLLGAKVEIENRAREDARNGTLKITPPPYTPRPL